MVKADFMLIVEELAAPLFKVKGGKSLGWGICAVMAFCLIMTMIHSVQEWYHDYAMVETIPPASHVLILDDPVMLIQQIPAEHLFGGGSIAGDIPITNLQLHLTGILKSPQEGFSRAIISMSGQAGKAYAVGDSLPLGIVINAILADGVILENGGHIEKLPLERATLHFLKMPKRM